MNTLIENLNALMTVKKELNKVLIDNEQPGGPVFDTYPEQFRELFRVLEDKLDDIEEGPYATYQPETVVAKPTIGFENNVVTLTCATQGAQIHFKTKDIHGNIQGDSIYVGRFSIRRDTWIETYAILNGVRSSKPDNSRWCCYQAGGSVPAPEFDRTNGIVTITCRQQNAQIWWRILPSTEFVLYTGPELVDGTKWLEAYAVYQGKGSETAISEGTEEGITVADPILTCSDNIVTITCATEDAVIWYKTNLDDEWTVYTEPIQISVDTIFTAYAYKEGNISNTVTYTAQYEEPYIPPVVVPADPVFSISNNIVTITCSTSGATIYYREVGDVEWTEYSGGITISEDTDFEAYSELNGETSDTVVYSAEYINPEIPAEPVFSMSGDVVTITCSTPGATIRYRIIGQAGEFTYSEPITITQDTTFKARSRKNSIYSEWVEYFADYQEPIIIPDNPVINYSYNVVRISCSTLSATIYYSFDNVNFSIYSGPFKINSNCTVYSYSDVNGSSSSTVSKYCAYVEPKDNYLTIEFQHTGQLTWSCHRDIADSYPSVAEEAQPIFEFRRNGSEWQSTWLRTVYVDESNVTSMFTIGVSNGDIVQFRKSYSGWDYLYNISFTSLTDHIVYGNIMSMYDNTSSFNVNTTLTEQSALASGYFKGMFSNDNGLKNISNLILPATTLSSACYDGMFDGCMNITGHAPVLPATGLTNNCYRKMFYHCYKLSYIKCMANNTSAYGCLEYWVAGTGRDISTEKIFVRNVLNEGWVIASSSNDYSGIPDGWTVQTASS